MSNKTPNQFQPNQFQKNIMAKYHEITYNDFLYFVEGSEKKVIALGLPNEKCVSNSADEDVLNDMWNRREYCLRNCGFKCLTDKAILSK